MIRDEDKSQAQLIEELHILRRRLALLEAEASGHMSQTGQQTQDRVHLLADVIELSPQPFMACDADGHALTCNTAFCKLTGYSQEELRSLRSVIDLVPPEFRERSKRAIKELRQTGQPQRYEQECLCKDGSRIPLEVFTYQVKDNNGSLHCYYSFISDIGERRRAEETIRQLAYHDSLTGLPNRLLFYDHLNKALNRARHTRRKLAMMLLDVDQLKYINDTLGHAVGDQTLKGIGDRLTSLLREGDVVGRLGGDEFLLLLPEISGGEDTAKVAQRILEAFRDPLAFEGHELYITSSIGIAIYPDDGDDADTLMRNADIAMYRAKEKGRNSYQRYASTKDARALLQ